MRQWHVLLRLVMLFGLASTAALADDRHRVIVLEPSQADATGEVRARLRGELEAAGFDVVVSIVRPGDDPQKVGEGMASELRAAAVLYVLERPVPASTTASPPEAPPEPIAAEIWISDRNLSRSFVLNFELDANDPGRVYSRMAVQAVEVLKANLAQLSVKREEPAPEPPVSPPTAPLPRPHPEPPRRGIGASIHAGGGLLQGFQGVDTAWTPVLRLGVSLPPEWLGNGPLTLDLLGTAAFFGEESSIQAAEGTAHIRQSLAAFEVWGRFSRNRAVQPFFSVSTGAYRTEVNGESPDPTLEQSSETWSLSSGLGTGLWSQPVTGLAFIAEGQALLAWAPTVVRIAEQEVATAGSPILLITLSVAGVF